MVFVIATKFSLIKAISLLYSTYFINRALNVLKSTPCTWLYVNINANKNPRSPTLLKNTAFRADLFASKRVYQKPINKYEIKPTSSQPKNNCTKLFDVTKISIAKAKKLI